MIRCSSESVCLWHSLKCPNGSLPGNAYDCKTSDGQRLLDESSLRPAWVVDGSLRGFVSLAVRFNGCLNRASISFGVLMVMLLLSWMPAWAQVKAGDDVFVAKYLNLIKGKTVGIITNQSGRLQDGKYLVDVLAKIPDVKVVGLFAPEHGIRGEASAGAKVSGSVDAKTGIPIYSLYGQTKKPTPKMLKGIDVLIYDIQDVGTRFYTFISTLYLSMEAAAENHVEFIVLDKPDMLRPDMVDGPVLADSLESFVGIQPIPSVYGMTPGELATMFNDNGMLKGGVKANLRVIRMTGYRRDMWYDQTGLKWVTPSPNLRDMNAVELYPGMVLIEATNTTEGRGTNHPFEKIGSPYINSNQLVALLEKQHVPGVEFKPTSFTPRPLPGASEPKYTGKLCHGIMMNVTDRNIFRPVEWGVTVVWALHKLYPEKFKFRDEYFDLLAGTTTVRKMITAEDTPGEIIASWQAGTKRFEKMREKYLLYK